ncbi:unnamed protein product [Rotaria socialis]|uniref:Uncharacterized protein n=1 Tax=Rotaria socialis TaxID=392032 RepID=A0A817KQB3_9BILA|nr:unnamed protein product [Rotaria socialis]CAF3279743.1 unnamed protein product [Rotaria socialis]CAF3372513.1 unnamed protein product [Rotaria socialis]CAF3488578.1 unnamed protein product [Rotaria socialis]CAF4150429.1 unnamed protein product [Rotaria socialis]
MGNSRSRVTPSRPLKILDSQTRARYKNRHELTRLNDKIRQITSEKNTAVSRITCDQHITKLQLHQMQHENDQRKFFKRLNRFNRRNSAASISESECSDASDTSLSDSPSLLVHNINTSLEWEKSIYIPGKQFDGKKTTKSSTILDTIQSQYSSKLDSLHAFDQTESSRLYDQLSLEQLTEVMKKSIKISVARAARDSNVAARRAAKIY